MNQKRIKITGIQKRFRFFISQFPLRMVRLVRQFGIFDTRFGLVKGIFLYFMSITFCVLDLFAIPEIYETIMDLSKWQARTLTNRERLIAKAVFTDSLNLDMVRIDERAVIGPKWGRFAYVSYHTINSYGKMSDAVFVHELMHVWQFTYLGSVYIVNALLAQNSKDGYDYKGLQRMHHVIDEGKSILAFNFEQQADIVCDYYRIAEGRKPQWSTAELDDLESYQYFINQIQNPKFLGLA